MRRKNAIWYPIAEAANVLGTSSVDVHRMVDAGELQAGIMTPRKRFLVFSAAPEGGMVGHATCSYAGPLRCHATVVDRLLAGKRVVLGGQPLHPLEMSALREWSANCPYLHVNESELVGWQPTSEMTVIEPPYALTPMPTEGPSRKAWAKFLDGSENTAKHNEVRDAFLPLFNKLAPTNYRLNYGGDDRFEPSALVVRVPARLPAEKQNSPVISETLPDDPPIEKVDSLARVMWSALREDIDMSAKQVWERLNREYESGDPVHDRDCVIVRFATDELVFLPYKDEEKFLSWSAFQSRVSRLKKGAREFLEER